jgi:hypothetical protein
MNIAAFLQHHSIECNPFRDEEARQDEIFERLLDDGFEHGELQKILGDVDHPASAIVFGEKGSGKTAIRLQIERRINRHNTQQPDRKTLTIAYDDLNPVLDRFARRVGGHDALSILYQLALNDHVDGILSLAVPDLVDAALQKRRGEQLDIGAGAMRIPGGLDRKTLRRMDRNTKRDWLILQALYDRSEEAERRGSLLKRKLHYGRPSRVRPLRWLCIVLWVLTAAAGIAAGFFFREQLDWVLITGLVALSVLTLAATGLVVEDFLRLNRLSRQLARQLRVLDRPRISFRRALERIPRRDLESAWLPIDDLDEPRYEMIARLRRAVRPFGYRSLIVLFDRVDEPTLVRGHADCMRAVVWPFLNNKFLQQPGVALKMMLPIELRYALYGESNQFFQEARLDKQNMIDRLEWSGATLYDLCNRRLRACATASDQRPSMRDLFDESVSREDIVAALDQMRQPRDAFKLMYQAIRLHCDGVTDEDDAWRIPSHVLRDALNRQKQRVDALRSGLTPA